MKTYKCEVCGEKRVLLRSTRRYCSSVCRQKAYRIRRAEKALFANAQLADRMVELARLPLANGQLVG